jgi:cysteinyl-tRNA synthetase
MIMLKIYNTLSQKKEVFKPLRPDEVGLYACGVTVYDRCHIGHARSMMVFDMLVSYLRYSGYTVNYVRNITDIDDKIIKRAAENNETCDQLTRRMIDIMHADERALGLTQPNHEPKATEHIDGIIELIQKLLAKQVAYVTASGDVCFAVEQFSDYGKLSNRNIDQLLAGTRGTLSHDKRNPLDFVLWKLAKPGEPQWDSPWGAGRPGWHIECSVMSSALLGQPFDIHGGGLDLKFPHHENEIAQSEAGCGCEYARYWVHAGLLTIDGEKMSKSLGNFLTIGDALEQYDAETLRCFMLSASYRSPVDYSIDTLKQMRKRLETLYTALRGLDLTQVATDTAYEEKFRAAMDDDFNTPLAMSVLFELAHEVNRQRETNRATANQLAALLRQLSNVLGFGKHDPDTFLQGAMRPEDIAKIDALIAARVQARADKDWARADEIRDELAAMQVVIEDAANGTTWRKL